MEVPPVSYLGIGGFLCSYQIKLRSSIYLYKLNLYNMKDIFDPTQRVDCLKKLGFKEERFAFENPLWLKKLESEETLIFHQQKKGKELLFELSLHSSNFSVHGNLRKSRLTYHQVCSTKQLKDYVNRYS